MLENLGPGFHRGARQARNVTGWVESCTHFIDHPTVINAGADFQTQLVLLHHSQVVVEIASDDLRLARIVVEMLLLASHLEMSTARKVAVDSLFLNDFLYAIHGLERCRVHALRAFTAVHRDKLVHSQLHPGKNHAAIAGTGAPTDALGFEDGNFRPSSGQSSGRG